MPVQDENRISKNKITSKPWDHITHKKNHVPPKISFFRNLHFRPLHPKAERGTDKETSQNDSTREIGITERACEGGQLTQLQHCPSP